MSVTHLRSPENAAEAAATRQLAVPGSLELQEALRRENEQLRTALASRIVIEQAKGMLAERCELDVDDAFELLRREARSHRMKLRVLAAAVTAREALDGGDLPAKRAEDRTARRGAARAAPLTVAPPKQPRFDLRAVTLSDGEH
jgi:hypothetical protein